MKKLLLSIFTLLFLQQAQAQLLISPNQTASFLANKLVATSGTLGVTVSNAVLTCDTNANGEFTGASNLGITDGIALGTGDVASNSLANTFGLDGHPGDFASTWNNNPGDTQLANIVGVTTYDACVLEFDLQPVGTFVEFEYVFGSEEYPNFICTPFNDIFGFFISGPGFSAPTNIALIPSTTTPVSINSINDGSGSCLADTSLYVTNTDTVITMNGFTVPMIATANVTSGATYHLKMAITDASDGVLNSYVILKANSLKSGNASSTGVNQLTKESGLEVFPTMMDNSLSINNLNGEEWKLQVNDINGRLIYSGTIASNQMNASINTSTLSEGIYILKAQRSSDNKSFVQKLIKN